MKYDFSQIIPRENTSCYKYDLRGKIFGRNDVIPMWVADMDIAVPDFVMDRLAQRLKHPIFGYTFRDAEYLQSIAQWCQMRYGWNVSTEWLSYCPGVVSGIINAIQAFTKPREKVLIQPPVYHPFFHCVEGNGRELITNPLVESGGGYTMDFDLLEQQLAEGVKMAILCSPHNPVGRVWTKEELTQFAQLCLKHGVLMVSDEIHADLVFSPHKHTPLATLSEGIANSTITFGSASKTFNLAGLACAHAIISNRNLKRRYDNQVQRNGADQGNPLSYEAVKAAYSQNGQVWLDELLAYLWGTVSLVNTHLSESQSPIKLVRPEGTYLLWFDFRATGIEHKEVTTMIIKQAGLGFNAGDMFGPQGKGFHRMNIACPRETVVEALGRLNEVFGV